jgi:cytidine deaminase
LPTKRWYNKANLDIARDFAFDALKSAQVGISGRRVGACVIATDKMGTIGIFSGCNIELANSMGIHAERVALVKAISEGYTKIETVCVTSSSKEQRAALCGYCRQDYMYVNPDCKIYVFNPDKTIKIKTTVIRTMRYPYLGAVRIK